MQVGLDSDFYTLDQDTWTATSPGDGIGEEPPVDNHLQSGSHLR
jgi:hypothetical protein